MSTAVEQRREIETLAWITDDEAEFWTSSSPRRKSAAFDLFSSSKKEPEKLPSKLLNDSDVKKEDPLLLSYKNKIEQEAKIVTENAGKKQLFEFDNTLDLNDNVPGVNMSFLDRLIHQLTRPRQSKVEYDSDEEFTDIDESEVTAIVNHNIQQTPEYNDTTKEESTFKDVILSFFGELNEETDVILGTIDQETLVNRRSHRARSSILSDDNKEELVNRNSI